VRATDGVVVAAAAAVGAGRHKLEIKQVVQAGE
jgi:hypothetical protein